MVPLSQPSPKQCFTPISTITKRCASTHFEEIQLAPSSIGISPLIIIHPPIFQHWWVRSSTLSYQSFNLIMIRSPGFGSINSDQKRFIQTRFHYGSGKTLTKPLPISRRLILQQAHSQSLYRSPAACKLMLSCSISLTSQCSFQLSLTVLVRYRSLRSI